MSDKINELINHLEEENVIGFGETLNDILLARISEAIKLKVEEVGAAVYSNPEQIDELSKKTLGSYIKNAANNLDINSAAATRNRIRSSTPGSKFAKMADAQDRKVFNRNKGIERATDRLTKEDVEQIDELSKKTLASYIKNASSGIKNSSWDSGFHVGRVGTKGTDSEASYDRAKKHNDKAKRREHGIYKAIDKLTKEDVDIDFDLDLSDIDFEAELGE